MAHWLDELNAALEARSTPARFFFRDDDAGWDDDRLLPLLDLFAEEQVPIDLAVIPDALAPDIARCLIDRKRERPGGLGLHQHGRSHRNHETAGRKCEFGPSRDFEAQYADIAAGSERLLDWFGDGLDLIFTPPWNRCGQVTVQALAELGFKVLSRDGTAAPLERFGLLELPVAIDWLKPRRGDEPDRPALGAQIAAAIARDQPVGVMLHHAELSEADRQALRDLLMYLRGHARAECLTMSAAAGLA